MTSLTKRLKFQRNKKEWCNFFDCLFSLKTHTEECIFDLFEFPILRAKFPLEEDFSEKLKIPCNFMLGEQDWVRKTGTGP